MSDSREMLRDAAGDEALSYALELAGEDAQAITQALFETDYCDIASISDGQLAATIGLLYLRINDISEQLADPDFDKGHEWRQRAKQARTHFGRALSFIKAEHNGRQVRYRKQAEAEQLTREKYAHEIELARQKAFAESRARIKEMREARGVKETKMMLSALWRVADASERRAIRELAQRTYPDHPWGPLDPEDVSENVVQQICTRYDGATVGAKTLARDFDLPTHIVREILERNGLWKGPARCRAAVPTETGMVSA